MTEVRVMSEEVQHSPVSSGVLSSADCLSHLTDLMELTSEGLDIEGDLRITHVMGLEEDLGHSMWFVVICVRPGPTPNAHGGGRRRGAVVGEVGWCEVVRASRQLLIATSSMNGILTGDVMWRQGREVPQEFDMSRLNSDLNQMSKKTNPINLLILVRMGMGLSIACYRVEPFQ
jgi:hypothetical protein